MSGAKNRRGSEIVLNTMDSRSWCRMIAATHRPSRDHDRAIVCVNSRPPQMNIKCQ